MNRFMNDGSSAEVAGKIIAEQTMDEGTDAAGVEDTTSLKKEGAEKPYKPHAFCYYRVARKECL